MKIQYTIILYDTKSDGWNNNSLSIIAGDEIILDKISLEYNDIIDSINSKSYNFTIDSKYDKFTLLYHNTGFYSYENYYSVYQNGNIIYSSPFGETPKKKIELVNYQESSKNLFKAQATPTPPPGCCDVGVGDTNSYVDYTTVSGVQVPSKTYSCDADYGPGGSYYCVCGYTNYYWCDGPVLDYADSYIWSSEDCQFNLAGPPGSSNC